MGPWPLTLPLPRSGPASGLQEIRELVTDENLLQFGCALGEEPALKVSAELGVPGPWSAEAGALYGAPDARALAAPSTSAAAGAAAGVEQGGWEEIVQESRPGLTYRAWRKPLRGGLYLYRSSTVMADVTPSQMRAFHLDDDLRCVSMWWVLGVGQSQTGRGGLESEGSTVRDELIGGAECR